MSTTRKRSFVAAMRFDVQQTDTKPDATERQER